MGTNFYLESTVRLPEAFGVPRIHIGKSSAGWCFALRVYPTRLYGSEYPRDADLRPANLGQWIGLLESTEAVGTARVVDENGTIYTAAEMVKEITSRSWERKQTFPNMWCQTEAEFLRLNHAENGPHGLLRHQVDGQHCIAHGEGTWDLIAGDFS